MSRQVAAKPTDLAQIPKAAEDVDDVEWVAVSEMRNMHSKALGCWCRMCDAIPCLACHVSLPVVNQVLNRNAQQLLKVWLAPHRAWMSM